MARFQIQGQTGTPVDFDPFATNGEDVSAAAPIFGAGTMDTSTTPASQPAPPGLTPVDFDPMAPDEDQTDPWSRFFAGAKDAASFGLADQSEAGVAAARAVEQKAGGLIGTVAPWLDQNAITGLPVRYALQQYDPQTFNDVYRNQLIQNQALSNAQSGYVKSAGELAGGAATALLGGPALTPARAIVGAGRSAIPLIPQLFAGAGDAGLYGLAHGALSVPMDPNASTEDALAAREANAVREGTIAAIAAPIAGAALHGATALGRGMFLNPLFSRTNPDDFAALQVAQAAHSDLANAGPRIGTVPDTYIPNAGELLKAPDGMLVDTLGTNAQRLMRNALNTRNDARSNFFDALDTRASQAGPGIVRSIQKGLGNGSGIEQQMADSINNGRAAARPFYQRSFTKPAFESSQRRAFFERMMATPRGKELAEEANDKIINSMRPLDQTTEMERVQAMKWALDEAIGEREKRLPNLSSRIKGSLRDLKEFRRQLMSTIDNKDFLEANRLYAGPAALNTASEQGAKDAARGVTPFEIKQHLAKLTPSERDAYRLGASRALELDTLSGNHLHDVAQGKFTNRNRIAQIAALMDHDPAAFRDLQTEINIQGQQAKVRRAAVGNSTTFSQMKEDQQASEMPDMAAELLHGVNHAATGNVMGMLQSLGGLARRAGGMTPKVAKRILEILGANNNNPLAASLGKAVQTLSQREINRQIRNSLAMYGAGAAAIRMYRKDPNNKYTAGINGWRPSATAAVQ